MPRRMALKPLAAERHRAWYWQRAQGYHHAADRASVPITRRELPRAVGAFPLAVRYIGERPVLHAILGAEPGRSAFVDPRGRWQGPYVPAYLRAHPFYLAERGGDRHVVAVDESADALQADAYTGEALFDAVDSPTPALQQVIDFLKAVGRSRVGTDRACRALESARVLCEWPLQLQIGEQSLQLGGLYRVDEKRLAALDAAAMAQLRDAGALEVAYGQLLSRGQCRRLEALVGARRREAQLPETEAVFSEPDLEQQIDWDQLDLGEDDAPASA